MSYTGQVYTAVYTHLTQYKCTQQCTHILHRTRVLSSVHMSYTGQVYTAVYTHLTQDKCTQQCTHNLHRTSVHSSVHVLHRTSVLSSVHTSYTGQVYTAVYTTSNKYCLDRIKTIKTKQIHYRGKVTLCGCPFTLVVSRCNVKQTQFM